ncbi:MAG: hypothetical protein EU536_00715 [Promethearchaeota archaeon]|nr:MAG: hypothetical protein EU536_00715 [Candidatus Lokiarchaeota archaeon]
MRKISIILMFLLVLGMGIIPDWHQTYTKTPIYSPNVQMVHSNINGTEPIFIDPLGDAFPNEDLWKIWVSHNESYLMFAVQIAGWFNETSDNYIWAMINVDNATGANISVCSFLVDYAIGVIFDIEGICMVFSDSNNQSNSFIPESSAELTPTTGYFSYSDHTLEFGYRLKAYHISNASGAVGFLNISLDQIVNLQFYSGLSESYGSPKDQAPDLDVGFLTYQVLASAPPPAPTLDPLGTPEPILPISHNGIISLSWTKVFSAAVYYLYWNTSIITTVGSLTPIATLSENTYVDTLTTNGSYYYAVVAANSAGISNLSNCEGVQVLLTAPRPPTLYPITPNPTIDATIDLLWGTLEEADTYLVYRGTFPINSTEGQIPIASVKDTNFSDTVLSNGIYYYAIIAENIWGSSPLSNCESVKVILSYEPPTLNPLSPEIDADGIIQLSWSAPNALPTYYIYRHNMPITNTCVLTLSPIANTTELTFNDTIDQNGIYYYAIVAGDEYRNSSISNCEWVTVAIPPPAPVLNPIHGSLSRWSLAYLSWNNTSPNVTLYYIYRNMSVIDTVIGLCPIATTSSIAFMDNLTSEGTYYYVVVASDGWANSSLSNCESFTAEIPIIPQGDPYTAAIIALLLSVVGLSALLVYWHSRRNSKTVTQIKKDLEDYWY